MSDEFQRSSDLLITHPHHSPLITLKLAGAEGFEPTNAGSKDRCLTTWRRPSMKDRMFSVRSPTVRESRRVGIAYARFLIRSTATLDMARAQPCDTGRRANQFRVRSG